MAQLPRNAAVFALAALAATQVWLLVNRGRDSQEATPSSVVRTLLAGDDLSQLSLVASSGENDSFNIRLRGAEWTVLMAFDIACVWCAEIAPLWKTWTSAADSVQLIGISTNPSEAALRYTTGHGWKLDEVLTLDGSNLTGVERALTGRTPWLFLLDREGKLVVADHGSAIPRIDSLIRGFGDR